MVRNEAAGDISRAKFGSNLVLAKGFFARVLEITLVKEFSLPCQLLSSSKGTSRQVATIHLGSVFNFPYFSALFSRTSK